MNSVNESGVYTGDRTRSHKVHILKDNNDFKTEYLIAIRRKKQILQVHKPKERNITLGRSSHCTISLPDPHLSRKVCEIILGPVPLLRSFRKGKEESKFIPIQPGKAFRFKPYEMILMENGDIIFNGTKTWNKTIFLLFSFLFMLFSGLTSKIMIPHGKINNLKAQGTIFSVVDKNNDDGIRISTDKLIIGEDLNPEKNLIINPNTTNQLTIFKTNSDISMQQSSNSRGETDRTYSIIVNRNSIAAVLNEELNKTISSAVHLIERGELKMAGRILIPIMPHVNDDQKKIIVQTLDPLVESQFKKAYMLMPYEPGKSREILQGIVESGLEILPTYGKAKKVLENERNPLIRNW